ncbi:hypothetical protein EDD15DRAFT_2394832 [Pisolithus albus]|nr:hypothetical protein EDD15DRAFT_2394832 [Pisolithus albus]
MAESTSTTTTTTTTKPPSAPTFSFTAPLPPSSSSSSSLKQRRVSLALPSSPRLVPAWNFRDDTGLASHKSSEQPATAMPERKGKVRKINNSVDEHCEPDSGLIIQQKKPRKKWTEEETQMLVAGCNTWGVGNWKAILKDPSLKFDNRSPVDLKDRFRTYFPDAYKEHYPNAKTHLSSKVRSTLPDGRSIFEKTRSKKRRPFTEEEDRALRAGYEKHGTVWAAIVKDPIFQEQNRRSTDLRDRFRNAFPELYQAAGYKPRNSSKKRREGGVLVPVRAATDDQLTTSRSHIGPTRKKRASRQGLLRGGTKSVPESATCSEEEESSGCEDDLGAGLLKCPPISTEASPSGDTPSSSEPFAEMDMETIDPLSEPLSIPDYMPSATASQTTWSGLETPVHSSTWSANAGSPTSSHISSDYLLNQSTSPYIRRVPTIGKSAWGAQDWFSANPRLETSAFYNSGASYADGLSPTPSSPFSFHQLSHGVMDRYDLFPTTTACFPPIVFAASLIHSNYAGDLIFGARTHQPQQQAYYAPGCGLGTPGLGLSGGVQQHPPGMRSIQMHTSALPGIDEIELASITLNDQVEIQRDPASAVSEIEVQKDDKEASLTVTTSLDLFGIASQNSGSMDDIVDLTHMTPPATPLDAARPLRSHSHAHHGHANGRSISVPPSEARLNGQSRSHNNNSSSSMSTNIHSHQFLPLGLCRSSTRSLLPHLCTPPRTICTGTPPIPPAPPAAASSSTGDTWRSSNLDNHDVPFLDLHYYYNHVHEGGNHECDSGSADSSRQGQALDLARSNTSLRSAPAISSSSYSSAVSHELQAAQALVVNTSLSSARMTHHRGTSFVSPQDLQLSRKASDNKRKRASWDGGTF